MRNKSRHGSVLHECIRLCSAAVRLDYVHRATRRSESDLGAMGPLPPSSSTNGDQHRTPRAFSDPSLGASPRIPTRRRPERLAVERVPPPKNDQLPLARSGNCEFGNRPTRPLSCDHMARREPKPRIAGKHAAQRKGHAASIGASVRAQYRSVTNAGVGFDPIAAIPGLSDRERAEFRAALRAVRTPEGREEIIRAAVSLGLLAQNAWLGIDAISRTFGALPSPKARAVALSIASVIGCALLPTLITTVEDPASGGSCAASSSCDHR